MYIYISIYIYIIGLTLTPATQAGSSRSGDEFAAGAPGRDTAHPLSHAQLPREDGTAEFVLLDFVGDGAVVEASLIVDPSATVCICMSIYIYMHVCIYIYIYIHIYVCIYTYYTHIFMYVYVYV